MESRSPDKINSPIQSKKDKLSYRHFAFGRASIFCLSPSTKSGARGGYKLMDVRDEKTLAPHHAQTNAEGGKSIQR